MPEFQEPEKQSGTPKTAVPKKGSIPRKGIAPRKRTAGGKAGGAAGPRIDVKAYRLLMEKFEGEQNLVLGIIAGTVAMIVSAAIWAVITVVTEYQIGFMAIGVGALVGIAIRYAGKGVTPVFGIVGAGLALIGCLLGNLSYICYFAAEAEKVSFFQIMGSLTPSIIVELLKLTFHPIDLLFYGIAVYEGYRLAIRRITHLDIMQARKDGLLEPEPQEAGAEEMQAE
ncbi:MAG: hypothetical protein ACYS8W_05895 [Planctomycetota bacterium]|jgi:hypothetical protein